MMSHVSNMIEAYVYNVARNIKTSEIVEYIIALLLCLYIPLTLTSNIKHALV